ncbi:molybdopterin-guanine dinucleotide biosynthesis protein B [Venenivibrio stagnispumantis]|uniref:Molybdopterin-guanine dinucleotide biosynthesis protein B n=1 Tax=Venenivibrio stagnispumantis TaxID=407998 RepID=A0AA45WM53_9AQUI|nr:molybdopterin-guanine dinucleotide biosynthesis protein B [Venenivibrio stagnispumantis]MCW4572832.1 molybdopterin-guanine dinucleotide biosynthesis protein B [Venenivibrio stagnispumantis]SMP13508.1 molybdopterin-guanine dinucleotide biosynthesis protein B [Venenivibrio stagnispumantis]
MKFPVIAIVGAHNSGKTTFLEKVVNILTEEGYNIAVIKHDPKGKAKTDTEGKDSYKIYQAGAKQVIIASPERLSIFVRVKDYNLEDIYNYIDKDVDMVLIEGFKAYPNIDKYEVIRKEENRDLLVKDITGVITDYYDYPLKFDINNPKEFIDYIKDKYLKR